MTKSSSDYALISSDSYNQWKIWKESHLAGIKYLIIDRDNSPITGYYGAAYKDTSTGEVIIAHRGTELNFRSGLQDVVTDIGMITTGVNTQIDHARAFTRRAIEIAHQTAEDGTQPNITVSGHSLGGTLAQITAHEFGLRGETFNAYGAANLHHGIPSGGDRVINHVRATDVVSAASHHFGSVRVYATPDHTNGPVGPDSVRTTRGRINRP